MDHVRFLLNGTPHDVPASVPAQRTLLRYLREDLRLTGSKEGCAEGDCGACTVAVGELTPAGGLRMRAINACIAFLPHLHGRTVVTVEGLSRPGERLHPCQQALVDTHGSQCGFCTPGFVMSLVVGAHEGALSSDQAIDDALAGNLCRCTGYGPIVAAARRLSPARLAEPAHPATSLLPALVAQTAGDLTIHHGTAISHAPVSLASFAKLVAAHPDAVIVAGATDVGLWVTKRHQRFARTVYAHRVNELHEISESNGTLRIGAAVTVANAMPALARRWPDLGELLRRYGSVQIRNSGTLGGNIANGSPIGDGAPALIALGAKVVLQHGETVRRLPLENFFIAYGKQDRQPGEFVGALEIPLTTAPDELSCHKISKRFDQDISAVCGCFALGLSSGTITAARIAFGGMAATPRRAVHVEQALLGKPWTAATIEAAMPAFAADFTPISDLRASAAYRMQVAQNLLRRTFHERQGGHERDAGRSATRLVGAGSVLSDITAD